MNLRRKTAGRKSSSIHVLNLDRDRIFDCLARCWIENEFVFEENSELAEMIIGNKDDIEALVKIIKSAVKEKIYIFYLIKNNDWTSIYSEDFSFESVKEYVSRWFYDVPNAIITVGYFEDDILDISYISRCKVKASIVMGDNLEIYGYEKTYDDNGWFKKKFGVDIDKIKKDCPVDDLFEVCQQIQNQLEIPLCLNVNEVKKNRKNYGAEVLKFNC